MKRSKQVTIRLQVLDGYWETIGADRLVGIRPENVSLGANQWGPDRASFDLARDPGRQFPDLSAFTPVEIEVGGVKVWSGRTMETPTNEAEYKINVQCEGWQYHLDDDNYNKVYVHNKLTEWNDTRQFPGTNLSVFTSSWQVQSDNGVTTISAPQGATIIGGTCAGVTLDTGPNKSVKRVVVHFENISMTGGAGQYQFYARGADGPAWSGFSDAFAIDMFGSTSPQAGSFSTNKRYIDVFIYRPAATVVEGVERSMRINSIQVFQDATYESANASVLKASSIISDALTQATSQLSPDRSGITTTTFSFPEFSTSSRRTPREIIQAANAAHNYITKVDVEKRFIFSPRPSAPEVEIGSWAGSEFDDASAGSGSEIYNRVVIEGNGPDGQPIEVIRTSASDPPTLVTRRGFNRTLIVPVNFGLTTPLGEQIGDVQLLAHRTTPLKGSAKVTGAGCRHISSGRTEGPERLLLRTGELLSISDRIDPDTGAVGRNGVIAEVTYTPSDDTATVSLDSSRTNHQVLLERLSVIVGS